MPDACLVEFSQDFLSLSPETTLQYFFVAEYFIFYAVFTKGNVVSPSNALFNW